MAAISQLFVPFYTIVDYRDNRHLGDSTIVKFTIAIYRDNRQYRASLVWNAGSEKVMEVSIPETKVSLKTFVLSHKQLPTSGANEKMQAHRDYR